MTKSEGATSGTTVDHTKTSTEYEKIITRTSSGRGGSGDKGNSRNNTIYSASGTNKYYKGGIEAFGAVLVMNYEKL